MRPFQGDIDRLLAAQDTPTRVLAALLLAGRAALWGCVAGTLLVGLVLSLAVIVQ